MNAHSGNDETKQTGQQAKKSRIQVLVIDDEKSFTEELQEFLIKSGYDCLSANTGQEGLKTLSKKDIDLLILDVLLPGMNGLDILKKVKTLYPEMEVIIVSGHGNMETVIKAMRLGAFDYLRKPFRHIDIQIAIERTKKYFDLQQKIKLIEKKNSLISKSLEEKTKRQFIGISPQILEIFELAKTASQYRETNVLITGESGTGKENIARIIHFMSDRRDNIFCPVNSSAITDSLLESEFFGHKKGSFTGAIADKIGFFEISNGGTLFMDEIADMPLNLQAKILRATEEKVITRVGDTNEIYTDFRIISATNHNLDKLVEEKKFRLDLLHRLNTFHIHIPPLRERNEDLEPLLTYFMESYAVKLNKPSPKISKEVIRFLKKYDFPGNVRELKNMIERAMILSKNNTLEVGDFTFGNRLIKPAGRPASSFNLAKQEKELILEALKKSGFNQKAASDILGISRDALIRKIKKYQISIVKSEG